MLRFDGFIARLGYVFTCITSTILFGLTSSYSFARILSGSLQHHGMVQPFILISSFSPRRLPAEKLLQKRCSRSIVFESRLLKAANVVTYFTTREEITTLRRSHALPLLLTATTFIRCRIRDTLQTIVIAKSEM